MKQKILIVTLLVFSLMAAFALKAHAQNNLTTLPGFDEKKYEQAKVHGSEVLGDETYITNTKTGAKITCSNDTIHFKLYQKWQHSFIHYGWTWKKRRDSPYKFYVIVVSKKDAELIKEWAKSNL